MKKEVCLMCIVCFFLGYFVADVVSKCGFGREHLTSSDPEHDPKQAPPGTWSGCGHGGACPGDWSGEHLTSSDPEHDPKQAPPGTWSGCGHGGACPGDWSG